MNKPIRIDVLKNTIENYIHVYETNENKLIWI